MSVCHHPSTPMLLDYASGALGDAWSLAVATHLALCPACRETVRQMETLGGVWLERAEGVAVSAATRDAVFARLDDPAPRAPAARATARSLLPEPLLSRAGGDVDRIRWKRLGGGAAQYLLPVSERGASARLLRIPAGKPVPEHSHRGREVTLVLAGAFSDATGHYGPGDFQEADDDLEHQPHAAPGTDCICLAITEAPLRFSSLAARIVQPFLGI